MPLKQCQPWFIVLIRMHYSDSMGGAMHLMSPVNMCLFNSFTPGIISKVEFLITLVNLIFKMLTNNYSDATWPSCSLKSPDNSIHLLLTNLCSWESVEVFETENVSSEWGLEPPTFGFRLNAATFSTFPFPFHYTGSGNQAPDSI